MLGEVNHNLSFCPIKGIEDAIITNSQLEQIPPFSLKGLRSDPIKILG